MKITLIAGSNREGATSTNLLRYIGQFIRAKMVSVEWIDLKELPLPLYSPDYDMVHPHAYKLKTAVQDATGLILATPEYHGSISGVLKNAIDYLDASQVSGKPVLSICSAGGPIGISSLTHLQGMIRNLHGVNCPEWISIGTGSHSFGPDGIPVDHAVRERVASTVDHFLELTHRLSVNIQPTLGRE